MSLLPCDQHGPHAPLLARTGQEFVAAVIAAADLDIRVVFGDRDFLRSTKRAWDALSIYQRLALLMDLLSFGLMPRPLARVLRRNAGGESRDGEDSWARILRHFATRYPALAFLQVEHEQYLLSSLSRLDKPLHSLCPVPDVLGDKELGDRRPCVLAVLGTTYASSVVRDWGQSVDRRELVNVRPGFWARFWFPISFILLMIAVPSFYLFQAASEAGMEPFSRVVTQSFHGDSGSDRAGPRFIYDGT